MNPNPLMLLLVAFVPVLAFKSTRGVRATDNKDDVAYDMMFPEDFIFSSATASYQVEGGWNASGKGENIWDHLVHERPSAVLDKSNGDVACDSYHKYEEDIRLAKELGTKMYRFSLSWSRLLPTGAIDIINTDGVRYYHALLDEIIANGITPMVTLYHWDLPQPLQDLGGFTTEAFVNYFVDFAEFVFKTFGNKVEYWITFNEPSAVCSGGYASGSKAPQILSPARGEYLCAHNLLKAHAKAYRLYQRSFKSEQKGRIGLATYIDAMWPKDPTNTEDVEAVNRWYQFSLGWFTHSIFSEEGDYPAVMKQRILAASVAQGLKRSRLPQFTTEEINELRGSADFFGLNHYTSTAVANLKATDVQTDEGTRKADAGLLTSSLPEWESTLAPWHRVVPEGLRKLLNYIKDEYNNPPLIITENGYPDSGGLKDVNRTRYFRLYLLEILKAIHLDGCKVFGYTAWSLMDNFEWLEGYVYRFGLHAVDFADPTRPRTPRMSAKFFQQLTATRRVPREDEIVYPDDSTATPSEAASTPSARATTALAALVSVVIVAVQSGLPAAAVTRTIH